MINFSVLVFGNQIPQHELEVALQSFARLYHSVTKKHRRRMRLFVLSDRPIKLLIKSLANDYKIGTAVREPSFLTKEALLAQSSIALVPASSFSKRNALTALSNGLPVISYAGFSLKNIVDNSCGMLISYKSREHNIEAFSDLLQQLYFDPEALKMLQKGAKKRHRLMEARLPHKGQVAAQEPELLTQVA